MLKPSVKRGLMLDFIPDEIICPAQVNPDRILNFNNKNIKQGDIVYIISRELRLEDNWAFVFAFELAQKYNKNLKIIINLPKFSKKQELFLMEGLNFFKKNSALNKIDFEISEKISQQAGALIFDFNPIVKPEFTDVDCAVFEVDSHNIIPARFISNKQEFSAATLRRKIYANLAGFLTEYPNTFTVQNGTSKEKIQEFIEYKLNSYSEFKNDPKKDVTSGLSPYLHFGFISSQRIALEVIKSKASRENKEAFLEELIVRKELADNFCLYGKSFNTLKGIPDWAKETLNAHRNDIRAYLYSLKEFEHAKTHSEYWNKIQKNLLQTGRIHGYLRMYWAKKILEWSKSPEEALKIAIYLNDEYALDGNDPNGYVGILWSIGGVHDRPFANRMIVGKIRYMGEKIKF
ncbi:MAG: hypothetical protein PHC64_04980 [Candidatus Gastranaerophilales bacterium]|nr:hypothetical protein [Candidatus Gastranaerophilales bacterium]